MLMIDLNADLGESFGNYRMGNDAAMMPHISSANIACGFHAGDPMVMRRTVKTALEHGVAVGAHPGLPDLQGFGRRKISFLPDEIYAMVLYQAGALQAFVKSEGSRLQHIKPHGALYHEAAHHQSLAEAVVHAAAAIGPDIILIGPSGSALEAAASNCSVPFASEIFADRAYEDDGTLVDRSREGAVIHDSETSVSRILSMLAGEPVLSINGHPLRLSGNTICLHGDHAGAVMFAARLNESIVNAGFSIASLKNHGL
jgi:5-oxoprolinase (ATP-hydrolysing) subunit A